jgi:patatin-like phospholipase/acyl hydrolase
MEPYSVSRFRILSLDGGGIRGTFTAAFLAEVEAMYNKKIYQHFDLITGTSTGGIIAIALGLGIQASEILDFYVKKGPVIFPAIGVKKKSQHILRWLFRTKYSQIALLNAISSVTGNRKLGESKVRLVIPSFNAVNGNVQLFKTSHHPRLRRDYLRPAVDVALATSAAPTYFPAFIGEDGLACIDGGIWSNCPAAVGIIEAISVLGRDLKDIEVLSIGTTDVPYHVSEQRRRKGGVLRWGLFSRDFIGLLMQAQQRASIAQAKVLLNVDEHPQRFHRIDEQAAPDRFQMDNAASIPDLRALGAEVARHQASVIDRQFLNEKAEPFVPCHPLP